MMFKLWSSFDPSWADLSERIDVITAQRGFIHHQQSSSGFEAPLPAFKEWTVVLFTAYGRNKARVWYQFPRKHCTISTSTAPRTAMLRAFAPAAQASASRSESVAFTASLASARQRSPANRPRCQTSHHSPPTKPCVCFPPSFAVKVAGDHGGARNAFVRAHAILADRFGTTNPRTQAVGAAASRLRRQ